MGHARRLSLVEHRAILPDHLQHLETSPVLHLTDLRWVTGCDVPVEPGWESEVVLGQVQDPRSGIDIDGFVGEAPRGVDRMWLAVLARPPGCGDLVDVAVLARQKGVVAAGEIRSDVGPVDRLLARDPRSPGCGAPGAVHLCTVGGHPGAVLLRRGADLDGHRSTLGHLVVRPSPVAEGGSRPVDLLVAHQPVATGPPVEGRHPVVPAGSDHAVDGEGTRRIEAPVLEPLGKVQANRVVPEVRHGPDRPVAAVVRCHTRGPGGEGRPGEHSLERTGHGGQTGGRDARPTQETSAIDN